jgi:tetratricopeptide (TPR) repeat protein
MKTKTVAFTFSMFLLFSLSTNAQEKDEYGKYGKDSAECVKNLSVYGEYFKQDLYKEAYNPWKWVFENCPKASENTYIRGAKMIEEKISKAKDKNLKSKLVDTLLMIYDQRIKYYNKKGYVLGRKGIDVMKYQGDLKKAYDILKESIEIEEYKSKGDVLYYCMLAALKMVQKEMAEKALIVETYDFTTELTSKNIKKGRKVKYYSKIEDNIEKMAAPFMGCDDLIEIYSKKFYSSPNDLELVKKITSLLDEKKCTDSELYFTTTKKLNELDPSAESAYLMGKMTLAKEQFNETTTYLKQAAELLQAEFNETQDSSYLDKKAKSYFYLAQAYQGLGQYLTSRSYAYNSLEINEDNAKAYMLIGDLYASSASSCGDNEVTEKVAYWAAVDKYAKARALAKENGEDAIANAASQKIGAYSARFPDKENLFFYNLNPGDTYKVDDCWINETTTVRAR